MSELSILPIFPHTIAINTLSTKQVDSNAEQYIQSLKYRKTSFDESHSKSMTSTNYAVLDNLPILKKSILTEFYQLKNNYLFHTKNDFTITTSWSTKTREGDYSKFHNHQNCFYSGVFYFQGNDNTGKIKFNNPFKKAWHVESTNHNELNMNQMAISPEKNMLIFFPSYMDHAIQQHKSPTTRYSLAFNLIPVGPIGMDDSSVVLEVPDN